MLSKPLLPLVITTGLLDSFNPCAIAILLIFIGLLLTLRRNRKIVILMCLSYIASVYITYFLIGLGILRVMHIFSIPHIMIRIGAAIVIIVGLINLKDFFFPNLPISTRISVGSRQIISKYTFKATIPAAAFVGLLVGIFEFPCSGAIYLAVLGLISAKTTFLKGISYLLLYNLMFILPLIIIFLFATNRLVVEKMLNFEEGHQRLMRLIMDVIMLGLGFSMLIWFV